MARSVVLRKIGTTVELWRIPRACVLQTMYTKPVQADQPMRTKLDRVEQRVWQNILRNSKQIGAQVSGFCLAGIKGDVKSDSES